jgi:hypothetical protein
MVPTEPKVPVSKPMTKARVFTKCPFALPDVNSTALF